MRMIHLLAVSFVMTFSPAHAEQSTGTEYSEREACWRASTAATSDMVYAAVTIGCKDDSKDPDCDGDFLVVEDFYKIEDCVCTDRTPGVPDPGRYDKSKRNPDRWVCTKNYYKIPGKW
jgi:hypothetical protein